jgi:hypothetical protein
MIDQGRPLGYTIASMAFFAATSAVDTFPVDTLLRTAMLPAVGDYPSETAPIAWNAGQLLDRPLHRFDPEFLYSHSNTHAYWQSVLLPGAMAAPLLRLTGVPLLTVNVLLVLAPILSVGLATGLAFAWTGSVVASLLAGRVFAHVPNRMDHLGTLIVRMGCRRPGVL